MTPRETNTLATVSLVCGILTWIALPVVGAIAAVITGHLARKEIRQAPERCDNDWMALVGMISGYIHIAAIVLGIALLVLFFGGVAWFGMTR